MNTTNGILSLPSASSNAEPPQEWAIFPCHSINQGGCSCLRANCQSPGKHPRTPNGLRDATADRQQQEAWWDRWPDANLAIATGEINNLVVVDIDPAKGGSESLLQIEEQHGQFPETVEVETGGQGIHLYYRYPPGVQIGSRNAWRPGIDIKANGGYVLAPPSNHISGGKYRFPHAPS